MNERKNAAVQVGVQIAIIEVQPTGVSNIESVRETQQAKAVRCWNSQTLLRTHILGPLAITAGRCHSYESGQPSCTTNPLHCHVAAAAVAVSAAPHLPPSHSIPAACVS